MCFESFALRPVLLVPLVILRKPRHRALGLRRSRNHPTQCFHFTEHEAKAYKLEKKLLKKQMVDFWYWD